MDTQEPIAVAEGLVKELQGRINGGGMGLQDAEAKILEMVNWIGDAMVQEVVAGLDEPTCANQISVGGEVAGTHGIPPLPGRWMADRQWLDRGTVQVRDRSSVQRQRHEMASARQPLRPTHPSGAAQRRPEELLQPT